MSTRQPLLRTDFGSIGNEATLDNASKIRNRINCPIPKEVFIEALNSLQLASFDRYTAFLADLKAIILNTRQEGSPVLVRRVCLATNLRTIEGLSYYGQPTTGFYISGAGHAGAVLLLHVLVEDGGLEEGHGGEPLVAGG